MNTLCWSHITENYSATNTAVWMCLSHKPDTRGDVADDYTHVEAFCRDLVGLTTETQEDLEGDCGVGVELGVCINGHRTF